MPVWQALLFGLGFLIEGGALVALGVWSERRSTLREQEALLKWMESQENINLSLMNALADVRMRGAVDDIVAHYRASQSEME